MKTMKKMLAKILDQNKELIKIVTVLEDKAGQRKKEEILVPNSIRVSICVFIEAHNLSLL